MFTAVVPPEHVAEELDAFLEPRRSARPDPRQEREPLRWNRPETWHLTLGFMADVEERQLDELVERLTRVGARRRSFELSLGGGGAFPDPLEARALFCGVGGDSAARDELRRLAIGARSAATGAGTQVQGGRFRPHLTLARLRRPDDVVRWLRVLDTFTSSIWRVEEFALVRSHLGGGPRGTARHEVLDVFGLRNSR